jgi:hypothetical protein
MDQVTEETSRTDYRAATLTCALRTCASVTSDLLGLHPKAEALRKQMAADDDGGGECGRSLSRLLWQELFDEERACLGATGAYYVDTSEGTGPQYWQRRQRLCGWKQKRAATASLPAPWPKILEMPSAAARQLCVAIGTEMVTRAFAGQSFAKLVGALGPLGADVAGQVIERLRRATVSTPPPAIAERWRDAYARMARNVNGERIVSGLGRGLLAALYRRLPQEGRAAAVAASRSKLPEVLAADEFLEPVGAEELAMAQAMAQALMPRGGAAAARANVPAAAAPGGPPR